MPKEKTEDYVIYIGTFDGSDNTFTWKKKDSFKKFAPANSSFKSICKDVVAYSYDELMEIYNSPRLDIELRKGNTMVKWFGVYEKEDILDEDEDEK